ncbi:TonB-dependent receptor [Hymenobacter weizhouensis]|uniref:TonB-dependent receptor n=1 Tax=Hymenobacter sp. YIM 151500-1 TaxID=2987689 RepID=UPI0022272C7F|nr:TonB-dependent receptor [Hymenobacter sp. YIM 151500-1]UYZ61384.1 TonB-dependent receptor [Hymenobacter sp. YIM 151500-1]
MRRSFYASVALVPVAALSAQLSWAQGTTTSAMNGIITDKSGEGLPGATVIAVHNPTNTQYVAPTNSEGRFNIQNMRVGGPYTIRVTFVGYQEAVRENIFLTLGQNQRVDINLSEATTELAGVTVTGRQDPIINSGRTGAATTVQREQIERLPTLNRSFADFTRLTPQANGLNIGGRSASFNNFTVDGAVFNNAFGLSGSVGGQTNAQPISIDAIEQIQVSLAPYDVRQGSFTGAGINAITRAGSNQVTGSVYFFNRNQREFFLGRRVGDQEVAITDFRLQNYGFRVGGPVIKDKVFFFLNGERERRTDPPSGNFIASRTDLPANGTSVSQVSEAQLNTLSNFLQMQFNYNPGPYQGYSQRQNSDKVTARIDWNISQNHRLNVKYNLLRSLADVPPSNSGAITSRSGTQFGLPFQSAYYEINNNLDSYIAELNSTFGTRFSNNLTVGYTAFRDFRVAASPSIFPFVEIGNGAPGQNVNQTLTSFGFEPFTAGNLLDTDVYQFGDNFTAFLGKHNVTVGTYNEHYRFRNGFAPNYNGLFRFNSLEDFYSANGFAYDRTTNALTPLGAGTARALPSQFQLQYAANADGEFPYARIEATQLGLYVQDEYTPFSNLRVTVGVRGDLPIISSDVEQNQNAANLTFRDGVRINTGQLPNSRVLFSPRVGFNWDVNDDKKTQLRGGTGVFTGRVPFVWISNQASNNGVLFGSIFANNAATGIGNYPFRTDVSAYVPASRAANTQYNLAVTDRDFKFPQVWRTNLAVDQELPGGIVATLEGFYTRDLNAVYLQNVNLPGSESAPFARANGPDNRPIFYTFGALNTTGNNAGLYTVAPVGTGANARQSLISNNRIYSGQGGATAANPNITDAILLKNTNKGYSYAVTGQLQKSFDSGLFASLAYTYTDARTVNDGGSIAQSQWRDRPVSGDPNANVLSYANFLQRHRIVTVGSYRREYFNHLGTTLSVFYTGAPQGRFSYLYGGDVNGDGAGGNNDLIYIPRNRGEIILRDLTFFAGTPQQYTYTADQQYADLDAYINQDEYLRNRRGEYAERNGGEFPWLHQVDLKLIQDIFYNETNRHTLQLSLDIFNVGNLLNSEWGTIQATNRNSGVLNFSGYTAQGQPAFTFPYLTNPTRATDGTVTPAVPLSRTFRDNVTTIGSRWQAQVGVRYIFN